MRSRRLFGLLTVTAAVFGLVVAVGDQAAVAGASHPPVTDGYVDYTPPAATVNCSNNTPQSVTFTGTWNASGLHGPYSATVEMIVSSSDPNVPQQTVVGHTVSITKGGNGTINQTLTIPSGIWTDAYVAVDAPGGAYSYAGVGTSLACPSPVVVTPADPAVTMSPITCGGSFNVTIINPSSNTVSWYYTLLFQPGGFIPGGSAVAPGQRVVVPVNGSPGQVWPPYVVVQLGTSSTTGYTGGFDAAAFALHRRICTFTKQPHPSVSGFFHTRHWVHVQTGRWSPNPRFGFQWRLNGRNIPGATHPNLWITGADKGKRLSVTVTASRPGYRTVSDTTIGRRIR